MRVNDSWDIYAQRVGGQRDADRRHRPEAHEGGPAYSPDGSLIAFHEVRRDGGESRRRRDG